MNVRLAYRRAAELVGADRATAIAVGCALAVLLLLVTGPCERVGPGDIERIRDAEAAVLAVCDHRVPIEAATRGATTLIRYRDEVPDQRFPLHGAGGVLSMNRLVAKTRARLAARDSARCRSRVPPILRQLSVPPSG